MVTGFFSFFFLPFLAGATVAFFLIDFDLDLRITFLAWTRLAKEGLAMFFFIFLSLSLGVVRCESMAKEVLEREGFTEEYMLIYGLRPRYS